MARNSNLLTSQEAKNIDIKAKDYFGISTLVLMENAGRAIVQEALKILPKTKSVSIFCGKGNNGGDGFVAARHFMAYGIKPELFLAESVSVVANEARVNLRILSKLKHKIIEAKEKNLLFIRRRSKKSALIIDALLGTGLKDEVRGIYRDLIEIINASGAYVLSVDIPSGLDANNGRKLGSCVKADKTVTFFAKKQGMIQGEGRRYCGKIIVRDLGMPFEELKRKGG